MGNSVTPFIYNTLTLNRDRLVGKLAAARKRKREPAGKWETKNSLAGTHVNQ